MVGRNDPCTCGSGKKYKKCCESKAVFTIEEVQSEELERFLQNFYDGYPKKPDLQAYLDLVQQWRERLGQYLVEEMIEAIVMDEFFFHHKRDIWMNYLERQRKKVVRPSVAEVLDTWHEPRVFIGEVIGVDEAYMTVKNSLEDEIIQLRRESEKPVPVGVHLYCFVLPDGSSEENGYLAVSSLIFFPTDHKKVFDVFVKRFEAQNNESSAAYLKDNGIGFWTLLGEDGYDGSEFTNFEVGVLHEAMAFLEENGRESDQLMDILEDYLVEQQPNARKDVAIAAGAIRFGQDQSLFESLNMTVKEIAESFNVSTSSLNKYYRDLIEYESRVK